MPGRGRFTHRDDILRPLRSRFTALDQATRLRNVESIGQRAVKDLPAAIGDPHLAQTFTENAASPPADPSGTTPRELTRFLARQRGTHLFNAPRPPDIPTRSGYVWWIRNKGAGSCDPPVDSKGD